MRLLPAICAAMVILYCALDCLEAVGALTSPGVAFDFRTGAVLRVDQRSPAWFAGIRTGDKVNFAVAGWATHLSLNRTGLLAGQRISLPMVRRGTYFTATLIAPPVAPPADAILYVVAALFTLAYAGIGFALYYLRRNAASLVFLLFACGQAVSFFDNLAPLLIAPPFLMPVAMLCAGVGPLLASYGLLYFAAVFANPSPWIDRVRSFFILPFALAMAALYYYHFYTYTIWPDPFPTYLVFSTLQWLTYALAAVMITLRMGHDVATAARLRWVAAGIWLQALTFAAFFIDQNTATPGSHGSAVISYINAWFQPAILCIGYALLRTRVVDARIVGARTLVYGLLTAVPIALFSIVDWFFARQLEDARLATFAEFGIAVLFGVWLNTLHKRIDRFVERIVFARRHHAFQRLRHAIHALPSVERSASALAMLCNEPAEALGLASSAVFIERAGTYECTHQIGWKGCSEQLHADDPLVLFARAHLRTVHLKDVTPSATTMPDGDAAPELAVPIGARGQIMGVALYGRHRSGEHIDIDEQDLLTELAHAAGAALERLASVERLRELEAENALLLHGGAPPFKTV